MKKTLALSLALLLSACSEQPAVQETAQEKAPEAKPVQVAQSQFKEGVHYEIVNPNGEVDQPTVTEFFSLACGNCYQMDSKYLPTIIPALAEGVKFEQKHVNFPGDQRGENIVRGFAVLQSLGMDKDIKNAMFTALDAVDHDHGAPGDDHGASIQTMDDIRAIFVANGADGEAFDKAAASEEVSEKVKNWRLEQSLYSIRSVPSFIVNNKYQVLFGEIQNVGQLVDLMNYLAHKDQ